MHILDLNELDTYCNSFLRVYSNYGSYVNDFFTTLYSTGCRSSEPHLITRWNDNGSGLITMQPLKGNNRRTIDGSTLPPDFLEAITNQQKYFDNYSIAKFRYIFNKYKTIEQLYVQGKEIDLYIFRYRYVKNLSYLGYTNAQIQNLMGWTNSSMVAEYLYADVYYI